MPPDNNRDPMELKVALIKLRQYTAEARSGAGDVVPQIREILDQAPVLWQHYGDLAGHSDRIWLDLLAGDDIVVRESLVRATENQRQELLSDGASPVERLLVDRVITSWLMSRFFDAGLAAAVQIDESRVRSLQQQLDRAQRRHCDALKALADVRRLISNTKSIGEFGVVYDEQDEGKSGVAFDLDDLPTDWGEPPLGGIGDG